MHREKDMQTIQTDPSRRPVGLFARPVKALTAAAATTAAFALGLFAAAPSFAQAGDTTDETTTVTLVNAGQGEKKPITLDFNEPGEMMMTVTITNATSSKQMMNGMEIPQPAPPTTAVIVDFGVKEKNPDGSAVMVFTINDVQVVEDPGGMAPMMMPVINQLKGVEGTMTVSKNGVISNATVPTPRGAMPGLAEQLDQTKRSVMDLVIPTPTEAMGVGGSWKVTQTFKTQGIELTRISTYTIESREGDTLKLKGTVTLKADAQQMTNDQMPPGMKLQLKKFDGTGDATMTYNLAAATTTASEGEATIDIDLEFGGEGMPGQAMTQKVQSTSTITAKPKD